VDKTEDYGNIRVRSVSEVNNKDYILRHFAVSRESSAAERQIYHFHFLGWPDHGTPEDPGSVLSFLHDVNLKQEWCCQLAENFRVSVPRKSTGAK
jgi:tyrosine-protein phosphatase non-receptor type 11